tara:strand:- start:522 stop:941 length:420 start_codon:yes stop_codon:yes gene_type:complete
VIKKKDLSEDDAKTWESYIKNPQDIFDKDKNISTKIKRKDRFKFDLHGFTLDNANSKVKELIHYCIKNKYKELLLVTGKGNHSTIDENVYISKELGKLKYSVPDFIKNEDDLSNYIISISDADDADGGGGAILLKFRNL